MKILFYNWVDYLDAERRGGGVSVYQKNLIDDLTASGDAECFFLSSGISYDLLSNAPRWEPVRHGSRENAERRFEIVNSGCMSPSHHSFGHETQLRHGPTEDAFYSFLEANGPFDIVHFNNLEGLPAAVLELKERFPQIRVIYSLHNYYPFCPQVNLWYQERETCKDYEDGRRCTGCLTFRHDTTVVRQANAVAYRFKRAGVTPGSKRFERFFGPAVEASVKSLSNFAKVSAGARDVQGFSQAVQEPADAGGLLERVEPEYRKFRRRREDFVALMNKHCDEVVCVSQRVADIAAELGLSRDLLKVLYIGTKHAENFARTSPKASLLSEDGTLTLGYLGYMRRDKGFYFLLDALEALPAKDAARIHLVVCARRGDEGTMHRLRNLGGTFASVRHADGYTHENLDELLSQVDVGVIPVLWEDNLPQVAIEMHSRHIPLITSNLGGAKELGNTSSMVFEAGNTSSLHALLTDLLAGRFDGEAYWASATAPVSMEEHRVAMIGTYNALAKSLHAPNDAGSEEKNEQSAAAYQNVAEVVQIKQATR